jgi:hypothetical protein
MTDFSVSGPVLTGASPAIVQEMNDQIVIAVAARGLESVQRILNEKIQNPTPYYETQIMVQEMGDVRVVHDRDIVYGPWLEGVSSRNSETRFKGYAAFRKSRQSLNGDIPRIISPIADMYIRKLGGA